jgi:hypothetical protein
MNENNPSSVPPQIPLPHLPPSGLQLGDDPAERVPIGNIILAVESLLRQPRRLMFQLRQPGAGKLIGAMLFATVVCALVYGVVIGSFSGGDQWWAAPVKVGAGLLIATLICLPSLYIFACLSGSQARVIEILGLVVGLLLLMTILLIGFAPVAWLFSQSTESVVWMGVLHLVFWGISTLFGLRFLEAGFSHSNARTNAGLNTWVVIFVLVILQMTTALRPLVGNSETLLPTQKKFFISHWSDCMGESSRR